MGIFDRVERRLERAVNSVFARAFKAEVQPVEIASAIRKAMDDRAVTPSRGHVLVPNVFTVVLSSTDFDRLSEFEDDIAKSSSSRPRSMSTEAIHPGGSDLGRPRDDRRPGDRGVPIAVRRNGPTGPRRG